MSKFNLNTHNITNSPVLIEYTMFQKYSDYHLLAPACVLFTFSVLVVADVYYYYTRKNFNVRTRDLDVLGAGYL